MGRSEGKTSSTSELEGFPLKLEFSVLGSRLPGKFFVSSLPLADALPLSTLCLQPAWNRRVR